MARTGTGIVLAAALLTAAVPGQASADAGGRWRGIVEGSYGRPWDHGQRQRVIRWMPRHGFNAYVHAPKEDLYQRTNWRDPYPDEEWKRIRAELRLARRRGVEWIPNISPALPLIPTPALPTRPPSLPLCFSCPADLEAMLGKLEPFRRAGVRTFMVSFDDVIPVFADPRDYAAYGAGNGAFGRANGDFLTQLLARLRERAPGARLLTVGKDYSGIADTVYLAALRTSLDPDVGVMWTGPGIPAQQIEPEDVRAYRKLIGRRPILWDNWSNDDTTGNAVRPVGTVRLFLGPYRRPAPVAHALGGVFLNPANEADAGTLPLATAGDYLSSPRRYHPRRSWLAAAAEQAGGRRRADGLRALAETSYSTKLDPADAPTFTRLSERLMTDVAAGSIDLGAAGALEDELGLVATSRKTLDRLPPPLAGDLRRLAESAALSARAGLTAVALLRAQHPEIAIRRSGAAFRGVATAPLASGVQEARGRLPAARLASSLAVPFAYGWRLGIGIDLPPYPVGPNAISTFLDRVSAVDAGWSAPSGGAVHVSVGDRTVPVGPDGAFTLARGACGRVVTATDDAGNRTRTRVPGCRLAT
jgi:hyaluronoglucosaminidase